MERCKNPSADDSASSDSRPMPLLVDMLRHQIVQVVGWFGSFTHLPSGHERLAHFRKFTIFQLQFTQRHYALLFKVSPLMGDFPDPKQCQS
jgi:hypothetical protein